VLQQHYQRDDYRRTDVEAGAFRKPDKHQIAFRLAVTIVLGPNPLRSSRRLLRRSTVSAVDRLYYSITRWLRIDIALGMCNKFCGERVDFRNICTTVVKSRLLEP
jgi:hypothetical protein